LKVVTANSWFAARHSGTENVYKIYAESFKGPDQLRKVMEEAKQIVNKVLAGV
jgi:phosphoglucomutase